MKTDCAPHSTSRQLSAYYSLAPFLAEPPAAGEAVQRNPLKNRGNPFEMTMKQNAMKTMLALACLCGALSAQAETATPPNYAVLSLVGEKITFNAFKMSTGTSLPPVRKLVVPMSTPVFDDGAIWGASAALKQWQPGAVEKDLAASDPLLYKLQGDIADSGSDAQAARDAIRALLKDVPATYLILITKSRGTTDLQLPDMDNSEYINGVPLEGLGFYVDEMKSLKSKSGQSLTGFFSSYVYIRASLLDAKTLEVIRAKTYSHSDAFLNIDGDLHAANGLTEQGMERSLLKLVRISSYNAVSDLLSPAAPVN
jgi:hypothetical protein